MPVGRTFGPYDPPRHWGRLAGERWAVVDRLRDRRLDYAGLDREADRWAGVLRARGVGRGDRVALLSNARIEAAALLFACGRLGAALAPLNWRLAVAELSPIVADAAPRLVVGEGAFGALAGSAGVPDSAWLDLDADAPGALGRAEPGGDAPAAEAEDPLLVLYTSGSTGRPKGALLPHRQVVANAIATTTAWELGPGDVAPMASPLFHTGAWNVLSTPLWHRGGTVVILDRFEPDGFLQALGEERCTVAFGVPTQLMMLIDRPAWGRDLPALRRLWSGGAPCPPDLARRIRASGLRLREGFGLTECGPNCFAISDAEAERKPGCVGRPVPMLEARVVPVEDPGADGPLAPGELWLRGPQVFAGYLGAPELTAEAVTPDGWLRTGDLVQRDADGAFYICGRRKEMFISGGENVYTGEVERVLAAHPGVAEVAVLGVPHERWGEVGRAFVVPRGSPPTEAALLGHAREMLAGYKVPRSVVFLEALPRLASGKVDRRALAPPPMGSGQ